ncbi:LysM peptidoglycan-binding domain-containing protein [Robertmurraya korlensis]|uniref:LysM peptidoglycan-binding domain-containing protein n=1 Tax=Robertmurraya korlensis TaxID=519977 RepID=UPI002041726B|nr:LysM peptidoglycan-binding domain-containing protein [Robertmurraya korlensis]MCM3601607.1 LysM peptidoglycan-binding domain-containing protein [Robertmurraya korlensis]
MDTFIRHKLLQNHSGAYELILYLDDTLTEFSQELGIKSSIRSDIMKQATLLIKNRYPSIKITVVKVVLGGFVMSTLPVAADRAFANTAIQQTNSNVFYSVSPGDTLWGLSKKFATSVDLIKSANKLSSDTLTIGQKLVIPKAIHTVQAGDTLYSLSKKYNTTVDSIKEANQMSSTTLSINQKLIIPAILEIPQTPAVAETTATPTSVTHTVVAGDTLYSLAKKYNTTVDALKKHNQLSSDVLSLGQILTIPSTQSVATTPGPTTTTPSLPDTYTVVSGDSLYSIALKFGLTVDELRSRNQLVSDVLRIGQVLQISDKAVSTPISTVSFTTHKVQAGDSIWSLSIKYGIPQAELLQANGLTTSSMLSIGQELRIPVHKIPVKETVSPNHGELLNWWTEAQYVFTIGKVAKVTDLATGKSFTIKRTIGANHADCETLTVSDTNTAKTIWGGYSWTARAVIVEVDGRKLAASMSFYPHEREYIMDNGITGHFDVYFSDSTRHVDGKTDPSHQAQVEKAAGVR